MRKINIEPNNFIIAIIGGVFVGLVLIISDALVQVVMGHNFSILKFIVELLSPLVILWIVIFIALFHRKKNKSKRKRK